VLLGGIGAATNEASPHHTHLSHHQTHHTPNTSQIHHTLSLAADPGPLRSSPLFCS
jgi:hypothetical protein